MLAEPPKLGPRAHFRSRGLSRFRIWLVRGFAKILIIYSAERAGIDMLRVVHGPSDLDALDLDARVAASSQP